MKQLHNTFTAILLAALLLFVTAAPVHAGEYFRTIQGSQKIDAAAHSGAGLDDMTTGGTYTGTEDACYVIEIDGTGTPDTFKWRDNCSFGAYDATTVNISGSAQTLNNGVTITFDATTGHTSGDTWTFDAKAINPMKVMAGDGTVLMEMKNDGELDMSSLTDLEVTGAATLNSTLGVTGDSTFSSVMSLKKVAATNFAVTTPALTFDTTLDIPAGAVIVGVRMRLDTAITAAGNADRVGIGDASCTDPDKYAETTAVTANAKDANIPDWSVLGSEESIFICAMQDASQAATGNIGGADETITVEVSYYEINALPDL